jgi:ABC-type Zn uptake system ZnuABC Zn-binding protein ZnuA
MLKRIHQLASSLVVTGSLLLAAGSQTVPAAAGEEEGETSRRTIRVVTTLTDYAWVAREIGGPRVEVQAIARGNQDSHFVRPRPSYAALLQRADLFVTTGLDLELWVPTILDAAGNRQILEGADGYVSAWPGVKLLDVPEVLSRSEGDVHIYGNPHIHTDPLNMIAIARNILAGLQKIDPDGAASYEERELALEDRLHRRLFGDALVDLLGGDTLARLAVAGKLHSFLKGKEYPRDSGRMLSERLGGWLKQAEPLRGRKIIGYHRNWIYFATRFDLDVVGHVEVKPGIPPTPRHVEALIDLIREQGIQVILTSNYFDPAKPQIIAHRTGARVVVVSLSTAGEEASPGYEELIDTWIERLLEAFEATDMGC